MMYVLVLLCSFSVFLIRDKCDGANILVYVAIPSYSHQIGFRPLWQELAKKGHKITLLTSNLMEDNENITQIDLSETYKIVEKYNIYNKLSSDAPIFETIKSLKNIYKELLEYELSHPEIQKFLRKEKTFDLVISEAMSIVGLLLSARLNKPHIWVISMDANMDAHEAVGNPTHPISNPDINLPLSINSSFKERVLSILYWSAWKLSTVYFFLPIHKLLLKEFIDEETPMNEITKNISMLFINACPIFNNIRPLGPKTINIVDGIHILQPKPLPKS